MACICMDNVENLLNPLKVNHGPIRDKYLVLVISLMYSQPPLIWINWWGRGFSDYPD
jgi:hypothetical protein